MLAYLSECEEPREQQLSQAPIEQALQKLSRMEYPAKEQFGRSMRHK